MPGWDMLWHRDDGDAVKHSCSNRAPGCTQPPPHPPSGDIPWPRWHPGGLRLGGPLQWGGIVLPTGAAGAEGGGAGRLRMGDTFPPPPPLVRWGGSVPVGTRLPSGSLWVLPHPRVAVPYLRWLRRWQHPPLLLPQEGLAIGHPQELCPTPWGSRVGLSPFWGPPVPVTSVSGGRQGSGASIPTPVPRGWCWHRSRQGWLARGMPPAQDGDNAACAIPHPGRDPSADTGLMGVPGQPRCLDQPNWKGMPWGSASPPRGGHHRSPARPRGDMLGWGQDGVPTQCV